MKLTPNKRRFGDPITPINQTISEGCLIHFAPNGIHNVHEMHLKAAQSPLSGS